MGVVMAAFATPAELATYLQTATEAEWQAGNPDVLDTSRATLLLDNASAEIRDECKWSITQETVTSQQLWTSQWEQGVIFLPTLRLTAFTLSVGGVSAVDGTDYHWDRNGSIVRFQRWWFARALNPVVEVTYTHGWAAVPHGVRAVCLELAAAAYPNPSQYRSEHIEGTVTVFNNTDLATDSRLNDYRYTGLA